MAKPFFFGAIRMIGLPDGLFLRICKNLRAQGCCFIIADGQTMDE
jgi:hypothetical protein